MSGDYLAGVISRHRGKGAIIDSSLLLLYFVGLYDPHQIGKFKRTRVYVAEDFRLLQRLLAHFAHVVTTPNVLTEVSNLSGQLPQPVRSRYFEEFKKQIAFLDEKYRPSSAVCRNPHFERLGLTDCAIADLSTDGYLVVTDDLALWVHLRTLRVDAINFNHIRPLGWSQT